MRRVSSVKLAEWGWLDRAESWGWIWNVCGCWKAHFHFQGWEVIQHVEIVNEWHENKCSRRFGWYDEVSYFLFILFCQSSALYFSSTAKHFHPIFLAIVVALICESCDVHNLMLYRNQSTIAAFSRQLYAMGVSTAADNKRTRAIQLHLTRFLHFHASSFPLKQSSTTFATTLLLSSSSSATLFFCYLRKCWRGSFVWEEKKRI